MFMGYSFDKISVNEIQRIESDFKNVDEYIKNKYRLSKQPQADLENFAKYNKIKTPLPIDKNEEGVFYLKDGSKIEYRYSLKDKMVHNEYVYPLNNKVYNLDIMYYDTKMLFMIRHNVGISFYDEYFEKNGDKIPHEKTLSHIINTNPKLLISKIEKLTTLQKGEIKKEIGDIYFHDKVDFYDELTRVIKKKYKNYNRGVWGIIMSVQLDNREKKLKQSFYEPIDSKEGCIVGMPCPSKLVEKINDVFYTTREIYLDDIDGSFIYQKDTDERYLKNYLDSYCIQSYTIQKP